MGKRRNQMKHHEFISIYILVVLQTIILLLIKQKPGQRMIIARAGFDQPHSV